MEKRKIEKMMYHAGKVLDLANELESHDKHEILPGVVNHLHRAFFWLSRLAAMHGVTNAGDNQKDES